MAKNLKNTLSVDNEEYNINAVYSDEAGKVTNPLTIKEAGEAERRFDGQSAQTISYVSAEKGGTFAKPIYVNNSDLSVSIPADAVITSGEIYNRIADLTGEQLLVWNNDDNYALQSISADSTIYKMTTIVGTSANFESFRKYALGGSIGLTYAPTNKYGKLRVTGIGDCEDTELLIPECDSSGAKITEIGSNAFEDNANITSVIIPNGITSIGEDAFNGCTNLTRVIMSDSVKTIGQGAFRGCTSLTRVEFGSGIESIGMQAFQNCTSLSDITMPDSITQLGGSAFDGCSQLEYVKMSNNLQVINSYTFNNCQILSTVILGTKLSTISSNAFNNCYLENIEIPASVKNIEANAFYGCNNLKTVVYHGKSADWQSITANEAVLSAAEEVNCTLEDYVFTPDDATTTTNYTISQYKGNASYLNVPHTYYGKPVVKIATDAFKNCTSITNIVIPDTISNIGEGAFSGCYNLESITLPFVGGVSNPDTASASTLFGYIFGTGSYTNSAKTTQNYSGSPVRYKEYYIPKKLKTVILTGGKLLYGAFNNCANITKITLPTSLTNIGSQAFIGCTGLTDVYYNGTWEDWSKVSEAIGSTSIASEFYKLLRVEPASRVANPVSLISAIKGPFIYICRDTEDEFNPSNKIFLKLPGERDIIEVSKGATRLNGPEDEYGRQMYYSYEGLAEIIARINLRLEALGGTNLALSSTVVAPLHSLEEVNSLVPDKEIEADIETDIVPTVQQLEEAIVNMSGLENIGKIPANTDNLVKLRKDLDELHDAVEYELLNNTESEIFAAESRIDKLEDWKKQVIQIYTWDD